MLVENWKMSFVTGSQVYGEPTQDSDIDLVIRGGYGVSDELRHIAPESICSGNEIEKYSELLNDGDFSIFRFGKLNLIICHSSEAYNAWLDAKDKCEELAFQDPFKIVDREAAVEIHKKSFKRYGVGNPR